MEVVNVFVSPITELFKGLIPPLKLQIGYFVHCESKFKQLKEKLEDLEKTRDAVQQRVVIAKKDLQSIDRVVEAWLERVGNETTRYDETSKVGLVMNGEAFHMINTKCWCSCGGGSRYDLGKKAEKKMAIINELLTEGKSFTVVSDPSLVGIDLMPPTNQDFEAFASREATRKEVMAALQDEGTNLIGVYGMGGIGKTTLMIQVGKQVKEEKLFDEVVMTTVSQNVDLERLQKEIADSLHLEQIEKFDCTSHRAKVLSERIKQERRILVILDDLWSPDLNIFDLGIPYGVHKGCKVVITTRRIDVCNFQRCQKYIDIVVLTDEDSWLLFKKNVGDVADSPVLQKVAEEVVKECGGLPIALVTLGRALRNKQDKLVWDDTAHQLKTSKLTEIEGMDSKVFASIKLSYDFLGNEIIQKCFLYCCFFPEDEKILLRELMVYVMGDEGIFEGLELTLNQARDKLQAILDRLVDSCLLLGERTSEGYIEKVWMHDIIRDVATLIASEERNGFFIKAGVGLKNWPEMVGKRLWPSNSIGKCLRLALMKNEIMELPDEPELPGILSLSLDWNLSLKKIPDSFFRRMGSLATLNLSFTGISILPSSLSFLVNLKTLYLEHCDHLNDISVIGKLKKLEILSLVKCDLHRLPEEIRGLTNLKLLDLSYNESLNTIPPKVISSLSRLENLYTHNCNIKWEVEGILGNGSNASLEEVASLPCLSSLTLDHELPELDISFSDGPNIWLDLVSDHCICDVSPPVPRPIKALMQRVENVRLNKCNGLKSMAQLVLEAGTAGFNNTKVLEINQCNDMEHLIMMNVGKEEEEEEIPRMQNKLKGWFFDGPAIGLFNNLTTLEIYDCEVIVSIFEPNLVIKCVPNLKQLYLCNLPNLETIWGEGDVPFRCLENLKEMNVFYCDKLRYLFSPSMARNLQQLEELEIIDCRSMVQVITSTSSSSSSSSDQDKEDDVHEKSICFPQITHLVLRNLPKLSSLLQGYSSIILDCPLKYLVVVRCGNLKMRIRLTHQCTAQLQAIKGDTEEWFQGLEWEDPRDKLHVQPLFEVIGEEEEEQEEEEEEEEEEEAVPRWSRCWNLRSWILRSQEPQMMDTQQICC